MPASSVACDAKALATTSAETAFAYARADYGVKNYTDGFCWIVDAAHGKVSDAIAGYGLSYLEGLGVNRDDREAFRAFKTAAEMGNVTAEFMTAKLYYQGVGTNPDSTSSEYWLNKTKESAEGLQLIEEDRKVAEQEQAKHAAGQLFWGVVAGFLFSDGGDNTAHQTYVPRSPLFYRGPERRSHPR